MLTALLVVLAAYLALTYALGMYLVIRLLAGRRVRQVLAGAPFRRHIRPIEAAPDEPTPLPPAPAEALPVPRRRAA